MSADAVKAAARVLVDTCDDDHAAAIATVLNRLAELEQGEVAVEWALRWPADDDMYGMYSDENGIEEREGEDDARYGRRMWASHGAVLVSREVRRGPWTQVQP